MKKLFIISILAIIGLRVNAQWQRAGLDSAWVEALTINGNNIFAATNYGMFLSSNNGVLWTSINTGLKNNGYGGYGTISLAIKGDTLFTGTQNNGDVFISLNNGQLWDSVNTGLPVNCYVYALCIKGDTIFAGIADACDSIVYMSSNFGGQWTAEKTGFTSTDNSTTTFVTNGNNIFAGTDEGVCFSSNNGSIWTAVNNGLTGVDLFINTLAISGSNILAATCGGVFISSNNGNNWAATNLTDNYINAFATKGDSIYAGGKNGVFFSKDSGSTWSTWNIWPYGKILALTIKSDTLFAGTVGGVWEIPLSQITSIEELNNNEGNIEVYPNPATDEIKVISNQCSVSSVEVYNLLGERLCNLPITGNCSPITINVSDFPSGVYVVEVKTEKGVSVKKFIKE